MAGPVIAMGRMRKARGRVRRPIAAALVAGVFVLTAGAPAAAAPASVADDEGPQFYTGVTIDVSGAIDGDVYASGQNVTISGDVTGDVIAAAQTIEVTGTVDGDVRLAAQDVSITGEVGRSATVFASSLTVAEDGSLGADLVTAAGTVTVAGDIGRDVYASVGRLVIDGSVGGDVTYTSDKDARITEGSVAGAVERVEPPQSPRMEISPWAALLGWMLGVFYAFIALSLIVLFAGLLFPRVLQRVTDRLTPSPWKALLVGFVASLAVPVALLFLAVTIIGAPLALALGLVWLLMVLATFVFGAHYLGRLVFRDRLHPAAMSLVGGVILIAALQIPWLNVVVWLAMVFFGLGAQLLEIQRQRPWQREPAPPAAPPHEPAASAAPPPPAQ